MNSKDGLILWTLGAAGTLLIYSAYKNHSPAETLKGYFTNTPPTPKIPDVITATGNYSGGGRPNNAYLNSNGIDVRNLPTVYQSHPNNNIPLHGYKAF